MQGTVMCQLTTKTKAGLKGTVCVCICLGYTVRDTGEKVQLLLCVIFLVPDAVRHMKGVERRVEKKADV